MTKFCCRWAARHEDDNSAIPLGVDLEAAYATEISRIDNPKLAEKCVVVNPDTLTLTRSTASMAARC